LLVLGNLKGSALAALEVASRDARCDPVLSAKADDAIHQLDDGGYRALLVDLTTPGAARFCHEARARRALFNVPLIALSPKLTDLAFSNALRWGADDVVMLGAADPLAARLEAVPDTTAPIIEATRGEAVIADPERSRCDVLGRVLANAGFSVKYATDEVSTRFYLTKSSVKLFVLNTELGDPTHLIGEARAAANSADWVVTTKTLDVDGVRGRLKGLAQVVVMSSHGPPENVLFALNLLGPRTTPQRAEVRALYGAIVLFRPVGLERDEFGFSYSVSSQGLYLRTLLPPPSERLWVEMTPPNVPRRVKLLAEVAWSRTFGEAGAETAPAGFGIRILDGLGDDLELWRGGFESLDVKVPLGGVPDVATASRSSFRVPLPSKRPPKARSSGTMSAIRISKAPDVGVSIDEMRAVSPSLSRVPAASTELTEPALPTEPTASPKTKSVVVPSSTWSAPEFTPKAGTAEPAPTAPQASASSQDAVLHAIRTSLVPGQLTKSVHPSQRAAQSNADPEPPASPDARQSTTKTADGAQIDYADDFVPARPVRTVLGMGTLAPGPATRGAVPATDSPDAPSPPMSIDEAVAPPPPAALQSYLADADLESLPPAPDAARDAEAEPETDAVPEQPSPPPRRHRESEVERSAEPPRPTPSLAQSGLIAAAVTLAILLIGPSLYRQFTSDELRGTAATQSNPNESATKEAAHRPGAPETAPAPADQIVGGARVGNVSPDPRHESQPEASQPEASQPEASQARPNDAPTPPPTQTTTVPDIPSEAKAIAATPSVDTATQPTQRAPDAPDLSTLSEDQAYLFVRSSIGARVYVHGVDVGTTNQWLRSRCGFRFIRLGTAPGAWLSDGKPSKLQCRSTNEIVLQPNDE
jgi:DNA-binding response OmpR family regulator